MPKEFVVVGINEISPVPGGEKTHFEVLMDSGEDYLHGHAFPKEMFAWRAAEYDIPHDDTATLLDIILHEPFIGEVDTSMEELGATPEVSRQFMAPVTANHPHGYPEGTLLPTHLFNAKTKAEARDAHLMRVALVKKSRGRVILTPSAEKGKLPAIGVAGVKALEAVDIVHGKRSLESENLAEKQAHAGRVRASLGLDEGVPWATSGRSTVIDKEGPARRYLEMVKDKGNPTITTVPDWVRAALPASELTGM